MDFELEVHPVGDASRAGDAISLRYWDGERFQIIVVDGGTDTSGEMLVEHIKAYYGADAKIAHVISTHPDTDHACGLRAILTKFEVGTLWLHGVWHHTAEMLEYFEDTRWTAAGLETAIRNQYSVIDELISLAADQGTPVFEPFQGQQIGPFTVLSPARDAYVRLVPQFRKTPAANVEALRKARMYIEPRTAPSWLEKALQKAASWVDEHWNVELLRENPVTAAENESSTILHATLGDTTILLTGDGGINALTWAYNYGQSIGLDISAPTVIQVPHHGSRSNVSPSILDTLLGPKQAMDIERGLAVVSAPKDDGKHPRKMVMNAFRRRGYPVHKTQGVYFRRYTSGMPQRHNEVEAQPFGWFTQVEEYD